MIRTLTHVFLSTQVRKSVPFSLPPLTVDVHLIHLHSLLSTTHPYAPMANASSPSTLVSDARYPGFSSLWTCRSQSSVPTFSDTMDSWLTCISTNSLTHTHSYRCRAISPLVSPHVPPSAPRIPPTPTSPSWQSFQSSPRSHHPTLQSGMMSLAPPSPPDPDASHLIGSRLPRRNSSTCSNSASSTPRPVPGPLLYTWPPRRPPETGVHVAITVPSTRTQCPTGTLCLIYTISLPHYRVPPFSPSWTWSVPTTRSHLPRQARHLDYISQFTSTICHVCGMDNVVADALSRIETNTLLTGQPPNVDFAAIAETQDTDPQIRSLQSSPTSTLVVEALPLPNSTRPLYCDTSTGTQQPLVPLPWRHTVFDSLHGLSHPGICATQNSSPLSLCLAGYQLRCSALDSLMHPRIEYGTLTRYYRIVTK